MHGVSENITNLILKPWFLLTIYRLCAVSDFFGIFFIVSWVFYQPQDPELQNAFNVIQNVWLYKLYIFEVPIILIPTLIFYIVYVLAVSAEDWNNANCCKRILIAIAGYIGFSFVFGAANIAGILILEITNWTWIAFTFLALGTSRFPNWRKASLEFYFTVIGWINSAKKHRIGSRYKGYTSFTKQQDKMMRLGATNWILNSDENNGFDYRDSTLSKYLEDQQKNQYMNLTFEGLRMNTSYDDSRLYKRFWKWYSYFYRDHVDEIDFVKGEYDRNRNFYNVIWYLLHMTLTGALALTTFILGPLYLLISRPITLFFPGFIVSYLYFGYNVNIWNTTKIDIFQIVMITIYLILCIILSILFCLNIKEQWLMYHIMPHLKHLKQYSELEANDKLKKITNHYYGMTVIPIRRAMVLEHFGPDLGPIILSYLPDKDEFDISTNISRAKVV